MKKSLLSVALLIILVTLAGCTAGTSSSSEPVGVDTGIASFIELLPVQYVAQTNAFISFFAKVLDGNGNPIKNEKVTFTSLSRVGMLNTTIASTDGTGKAKVTLYATTAGFATVQAEVFAGAGRVRDRKTVYFTSSDFSSGAQMALPTMVLDVNSVPGNSVFNETTDFDMFETQFDDTVEILATVRSEIGAPVAGESISWLMDFEGEILNSDSLTNTAGQAKAVIKVSPDSVRNTETFFNVQVIAGNGATNMVTLFLQPLTVDTAKSFLTADPPVVDVGETSDITAQIYLNTGRPLPAGVSVNFTASCGIIAPFGITDSDGSATAIFTAATTPGVCTISASVDGVVIGSVNVAVSTDLQVLPETQIAAPGDTRTFTIFGGEAPYRVFIDDATMVVTPIVVPASGGSFTVTVPITASPHSVKITVRDNVGNEDNATLEITTATSQLQIIPEQVSATGGNLINFTITGGSGVYTSTSSDVTVACNNLNTPADTLCDSEIGIWQSTDGQVINVQIPTNSPSTTVDINVIDSAGNTTSATITIVGGTTAGFAIIPTAQTISPTVIGATAVYDILGGTAPYSAYVSHPGLVNITPANPVAAAVPTQITLDVTFVPLEDTTIEITVYDSGGESVTATLLLSVFVQPLTVIPPTQTIANPVVTNFVDFLIIGGALGANPNEYLVFSHNSSLVTATFITPNTLRATVANIPPDDTTIDIDVVDNVGTVFTVTVTLDVNPVGTFTIIPADQTISPPALVAGAPVNYEILGGTGPYLVFSDNPGLVTVPASIVQNFPTTTLTALVAVVPTVDTDVTITVYDATGASVTATLYIDPNIEPLGVIPAQQTISSPVPTVSNVTFTIIGGRGPYDAFVDAPALLTIAPANSIPAGAPTTFTAIIGATLPLEDTTVTVTIQDTVTREEVTAEVIIDVVPLGSAAFIVRPEVQTIANPAGPVPGPASTAIYNIIGGTSPYTLYSNNTALVTVPASVAGLNPPFTATVAAVPAEDTVVEIQVYDASNNTVTVTLLLDVGAIGPMVMIPEIQTISPAAALSTASFLFLGGTGPYTAYSSHPGLITLAPINTPPFSSNVITATVTLPPTSDTNVDIVVYDSFGESVSGTLVLSVSATGSLVIIPGAQTY